MPKKARIFYPYPLPERNPHLLRLERDASLEAHRSWRKAKNAGDLNAKRMREVRSHLGIIRER